MNICVCLSLCVCPCLAVWLFEFVHWSSHLQVNLLWVNTKWRVNEENNSNGERESKVLERGKWIILCFRFGERKYYIHSLSHKETALVRRIISDGFLNIIFTQVSQGWSFRSECHKESFNVTKKKKHLKGNLNLLWGDLTHPSTCEMIFRLVSKLLLAVIFTK